jgi:hypothetical protein
MGGHVGYDRGDRVLTPTPSVAYTLHVGVISPLEEKTEDPSLKKRRVNFTDTRYRFRVHDPPRREEGSYR